MKKFIQFGFFNKKLLLPFGVAFVQIAINIMNIIINEKSKNTILEMIDTAVGEMIIIFVPLFHISAFKTNTNPLRYRSKKCKAFFHYFILFFIFSVYLLFLKF